MAELLLSTQKVDLAVIAFSDVPNFTRSDYHGVPQWLVPRAAKLGKDGLPGKDLIEKIISSSQKYDPDIVHVWGVESYWGLLSARGYIRKPTLLEMQGMKKACARVYTADLSLGELFECVSFKEIVKRKSLHSYKTDFAKWGLFEEEILRGHRYIDVQSDWMSSQVSVIQPKAQQFMVDLVLRPTYYFAAPWIDYQTEREKSLPLRSIFLAVSGSFPYKGIHVALRALALLRGQFPDARLRIAGLIQLKGIRQNGYARWLKRLCVALKVVDHVDWLGPLSAEGIVRELQLCSVSLVCSFVESYCLALAEPAFLGVPCVTSYCGGTSWLATDEKEALFYPPGDAVMCAYQIGRIFDSTALGCNLSSHSRKAGLVRHDIVTNSQRMMNIYQQVMNNASLE